METKKPVDSSPDRPDDLAAIRSLNWWQRDAEQFRTRLTPGTTILVREPIKQLRQQLAELIRIEDNLLASPCFEHHHSPTLIKFASCAAALTTKLSDELSLYDDTTAHVLPPDVLQQMLATVAQLVHTLRDQAKLWRVVVDYGTQFDEALAPLSYRGTLEPSFFRSLVRQIINNAAEVQHLTGLMPIDGITLSQLLQETRDEAEASIYAQGIMTAYLVVWATRNHRSWQTRQSTLVEAALLQNVGTLYLNRVSERSERLRNLVAHDDRDSQSLHFGAAIVARLPDSAADLPELVATHHERIDGTGFPHQLCRRKLSTSSRFLQAAVSVAKLQQIVSSTLDYRPEDNIMGDTAMLAAIHQLREDARYAKYDEALINRLLLSRCPETCALLDCISADVGPMPSALLHSWKTRRIDAAESLRAPHFHTATHHAVARPPAAAHHR